MAKGRWLTEEENRKRIKLYEQGFYDREIAEKCGVSLSTILSWRRRKNLPSVTERGGSDRELSKEGSRRLELYNQDLNDREIAEEFGLTPQSIWYWRKKNGLPLNKIHGPTRVRKKMFLELYERGFNDREIAKELGLTSQSIWYWRKEYGLPPKVPHKPSRKKDKK